MFKDETMHLRRAKQLLLAPLVVVLVLLNITPTVQAQDSELRFALSVSPSTGYVQVKPGEEAIHSITVRNKSTQPVTVTPRIVDFTTDGKTGEPVLSSSTTFTYLANADSLLEPITIAGGQQVILPLVIKPSNTAILHEHHLTVLFESEPTLATSGTSSLVPTIGSNLVVLVGDGTQPPRLSIESLQRLRVLDSFRPLAFTPLARNDSAVATLASGSAHIKNWRGKEVATFPIYPDAVLAKTTRELRAARPAPLVLPTDPAAEVATLLEPIPFRYTTPFLLGPYSVEFRLETTTPDGITTSTEQFTLFAFPFSALIIVVTTTGIVFGIRHFRQKRARELGKKSTDES